MSASYGILSTYPPTQCGLATFSIALGDALRSEGDRVGVVSIVDQLPDTTPAGVSHHWVRGQVNGCIAAAAALNNFDIAIVQHEFGIYGGRDGADVLEVTRRLWVPTITVLHTVLVTPTDHQRAIIQELVRHSATVVTMTHTARERLIEHYAVDPARVVVVPHGAIDNRTVTAPAFPAERPVILTWGLLGEGKGIEWAIEAMAQLGDVVPAPTYQVVGQTHPRVLEQHGERYRDMLEARVTRLGIGNSVSFDARYLDSAELRRVVQRADIILLPYDSVEQVTSGVLIEAITAGKAVVSTAFPHARELLASGAGLVVERQSPAALAAALRRVLCETGLAEEMAAEASRIAPSLLWPAVADQYRDLAHDALRLDIVLASA